LQQCNEGQRFFDIHLIDLNLLYFMFYSRSIKEKREQIVLVKTKVNLISIE